VDVQLPGFENPITFDLKNMVLDTTRFEQQPGFNNASDYANGKPYSIIPNLDVVYKDRPTMFFDEKRVCTTVYIPGQTVLMNSDTSVLFSEINEILYLIFCDGKIQMTEAAKMSSGPLDMKQYRLVHQQESKYICYVYTFLQI
jgi:hypothetical protein